MNSREGGRKGGGNEGGREIERERCESSSVLVEDIQLGKRSLRYSSYNLLQQA